jgi:hypothetical protein
MGKFRECLIHKLAVWRLWMNGNTGVSLFRVLMHDTEKLILSAIVGDRIATRIHRKIAGHHRLRTQNDFIEAYLDWASARITKPEKPLDAVQTAERFFPEHAEKARAWASVAGYK